ETGSAPRRGRGRVPALTEAAQARRAGLWGNPMGPFSRASPDEPTHEALQGEKQHGVPRLDGLDAEGDGEMRLADAGRAEEDDVLGALDEAQAGQLAELLAVDRGLKVEIKLVERLDPRQPGQLEPALDAALVPAAPLGLQGLGEEALVVEVALGRVLAHAVELGQQVLHLHPLEEAGQLHVATSSYTASGRRSTASVSAQSLAW